MWIWFPGTFAAGIGGRPVEWIFSHVNIDITVSRKVNNNTIHYCGMVFVLVYKERECECF